VGRALVERFLADGGAVVAVERDDVPVAGESLRDRAADPLGRAGDDVAPHRRGPYATVWG